MLERTARVNGERRRALYSPCGSYRYLLEIVWDSQLPLTGWVGLNPSTATELRDDPTLRREKSFADRWGFGGLVKTNLAAWRSTDPKGMLRRFDPLGPQNTPEWIAGQLPELVIACWGSHGLGHPLLKRQARALRELLGNRLHALTLTSSGEPGHALYLRGDLRPFPLHVLEAAIGRAGA